MGEIIEKDVIKIKELVNELFPLQEIKHIVRLGGMTNHSYHVELSKDNLVFRLPGEGTEELINRKDEKVATELASELGVDTEILYFDEKGNKIACYIDDAKTMDAASLKEKENIKRVAKIFKTLHSSKRDTKVLFDVFKVAKDYEDFIIANHVELFQDYEIFKEKVKKQEERYHLSYEKLVPCHNDSLCENWILSNDRMYLIDWEYAGMNDAMWDVADVSIEAGYGKAEDDYLLECYFGRKPSHEEYLRFVANKVFIDYLWSLWGLIRVPFEPSMVEYANARYERMKENLMVME